MKLDRIYRHPVKSVGSERLDGIDLEAGGSMPGDRVYALAHARGDWDPGQPEWMRCSNFVRVAGCPKLAAVETRFDVATRRVDCRLAGAPDLAADLSGEAGRQALADWAEAIAGADAPGPYRIAEAPETSLTDSPLQVPSMMSLASLRALGEVMGEDLDPRRFRGNLWVDGLEPWQELELVGREIAFGPVVLKALEPIVRCVATAANPATGERDANPLVPLKRLHGEPLFGMLVEVVAGGRLEAGAEGGVRSH